MSFTARTSPDFWKSAVIYQLYPRAFTLGGTLKDAEAMLPHLAELQVDYVYLTPIVAHDDDPDTEHWSDRQKRSGYGNPKNPYRMMDYYHVDPEYGTDEDLLHFVRTAHANGLLVMLDLVYLHCGPKAVFLKEHPDFVKLNEDGSIAFGPWHFPLINFESKSLCEYLWQNMTYFIEAFDVDGYRCDVGDGVPLDFWVEGAKRCRALKPDFVLLNEGSKPEYLCEAFDANYQFSWSTQLLHVFRDRESVALLREDCAEVERLYPTGGLRLRAIDNHDIANDSYETRLEKALGHRAVNAILVTNAMLDGIFFLYNGYEVCDEQPHSIFANRFYGKNLVIDWSKGFTEAGHERFELIAELNELRHTYAVLADGKTIWLENDASEDVISFLRVTDEDTFLVLVNARNANTHCTLTLPDGHVAAEPILEDSALIRFDGTACVADLLPYGYAVLSLS